MPTQEQINEVTKEGVEAFKTFIVKCKNEGVSLSESLQIWHEIATMIRKELEEEGYVIG